MNLGYLNVCRLCAGSCETSIPILEKTGSLDFAEKIKSYLHVDIKNSNDADDPRMCNCCYEKIINWDQYAEQVQKVQGMFLSMLAMRENVKADLLNEKADELQTEKVRERKKSKRKCKKVKKIQIGEFSDEDDLPLSSHGLVNQSTGVQNKVKGKEIKKMKHKIKLKIKPIRREIEKEEEEEKGDNTIDETDKKETGLEDSNSEEKFDMTGVQSLFTWECLECHILVKNWNALVKHCRGIHDTNAAVQCVCGKFLQSRASIMKHRMKHTIGYGYKCEVENCNKTFHRQQLLDIHSLSHMPKEQQPWMCCKCSRRFHTESLLKQHEKVHLPKEEKLIHPCEVCQKKFCSKSAVSAHIRAVHFGERPFVCDQCGHSFTSKGILHEHLTIHSDVYNFHCKDCNKSFKTKYRLKIHLDTHVETQYQCPICSLKLNTRRTLRMHLLVHKDVKAFQCTTCGKAFKRSKDLKNHYNLHTGRRPYVCPFCQRTFANGSNCRSHKRRMHPEELKMYEAALAAGQQPIILAPDGQGQNQIYDLNDSKHSPVDDKSMTPSQENNEVLDDKTQESEPLNLQRNVKIIKEEDKENEEIEEDEPDEVEEEEEEEGKEDKLVNSMGINGNENLATNIAQISFETQTHTVQFTTVHSVHNFYSYQSSSIPAFPGNPFFRQ